jgi:class 3 adenylate cyclase/tetratricopeptide (TPR) repeat protein
VVSCEACGQDNPAEAAFCLRCGSKLTQAPAAERRKVATLLFCDMSGSTAVGERVDAEAVRGIMLRYFHTMRGAIERHGGTVEKFIGDAVLAVFGVPVLHEDDALRAVRAAAEMQERLQELNEDLVRQFGIRIALRIGVNTGEVVTGDPSSREMIVTGDAVNVAARLEQSAAPGEVLLGAATQRLVSGAGVETEAVDPLALKGKTEPVPAFRLLRVRPGPAPRAQRMDAPLVGRSAELDLLMSAFRETLASQSCRLISVVGEAGVGKSRLVAEFVSLVDADATVVRGKCLSYGEGITFWPVSEIVREAAGIREGDSAARALQRISALVGEDEQRHLVAKCVAEAVGLSEPSATQEEIAWAVRRFLRSLAERRPLVAVIDDLQWAEPSLLDLVATLPSHVGDAPLLCLCVARPELLESRPDWSATIDLRGLDRADADALLTALLRGVAPDLRDRLARAADGNPLFLEELVAMLVEEGLVERRNGGWVTVRPLEALTIPTTLSVLLGARLDRLGPERATLERGAVEGEVFHRGAVLAVTPPPAHEAVATQLDRLADRDLVRPAPAQFADDAAFRFRHILIRDAAYNSMSKRLRAELHASFADWLEDRARGRLTEVEGILGYHLEQAYRYRVELGPVDEAGRVLARRAASHLGAAGGRAHARSDVGAAVKLLSRAAELEENEVARAALLILLGDALTYSGHLDEAVATLEKAVELASASSDRAVEWNARIVQAGVRVLHEPRRWTTEELRRVASEALPVLEDLGDHRGLARAWRLLADYHNALGQGAKSVDAAERAVVHARRAGETRLETESLIMTAGVLGPTGASEGIRKTRELLASSSGDLHVEAAMNAILGLYLALEGCFDEARAHCARTRALQEELGLRFYVASEAVFFTGTIELLAGRPEAAEASIRRGYEIFADAGELATLSTAAALLAETLVEQGRDEEAETYLRVAEEAGAEDDFATQTAWRRVQARILARRGDHERAETLAREAVGAAEGSDYLNIRGDAHRDLGRVLLESGRQAEAVTALLEAKRLYEQKGNVVSAASVEVVLADLASSTRS